MINLWALLLLLCVTLSGCNDSKPPIEADDFGYPKFSIYAKGKNVTGSEDNELAEWEFSGYKYNGDPIVIMVYNTNPSYNLSNTDDRTSVWSSWACQGESKICDNVAKAGDCFFPKGYCHCQTNKYETIDDQYTNADGSNDGSDKAICIFRKGQGLYLLITDPQNSDITDPNQYDSVNRVPSTAGFYTHGLWDMTGMWNDGQEAGGMNTDIEDRYEDGLAYFKILDRYYDDNSGYFHFSLKRGFGSVVPTPIASVLSNVTTAFDSAAESTFKRLNENPEYLLSLKLVLLLYMIVGGIAYLGGTTQMSQKEIISHFFKIVIVIQLLTTETSWNVFNDYFFTFFTDGLNEVISIVTRNETGAGSGVSFFDSLVNLLFSYETSTKINALLWSFPCGFLVIFIVYIAFIMVAIAIAKAVILYLLGYMAISLLIIVAPVFITFMLFQTTRSLFENWINQFANYFFQPVLALAALNLIIQVIVDRIYRILGFKACYEDWMKITGDFVISRAWMICSFNSQMATMAIPGYGYYDENDPEHFCGPYECTGYRYIDLPFLDPVSDASLIDAFHYKGDTLSTALLNESSILLVLTFLMLKFNDIVPDLAKGLAGTATLLNTGGANALANAANSITKDVGKAFSVAKELAMSTKAGKGFTKKMGEIKGKLRSGVSSLDKGLTKHVWGYETAKEGANNVRKGMVGALDAAEFVAGVALPPGSLGHLGEAQPTNEPSGLQASRYGKELQKRIDKATGQDKADAFDEKIEVWRNKKVDKIASYFEGDNPDMGTVEKIAGYFKGKSNKNTTRKRDNK